jgi:hypothetical protein
MEEGIGKRLCNYVVSLIKQLIVKAKLKLLMSSLNFPPEHPSLFTV